MPDKDEKKTKKRNKVVIEDLDSLKKTKRNPQNSPLLEEEDNLGFSKLTEENKNTTIKVENKSESSIPNVNINAPLKLDEKNSPQEEESNLEKNNKRVFILGSVVALIVIFFSFLILYIYFSKPQESQKIQESVEKIDEKAKR